MCLKLNEASPILEILYLQKILIKDVLHATIAVKILRAAFAARYCKN